MRWSFSYQRSYVHTEVILVMCLFILYEYPTSDCIMHRMPSHPSFAMLCSSVGFITEVLTCHASNSFLSERWKSDGSVIVRKIILQAIHSVQAIDTFCFRNAFLFFYQHTVFFNEFLVRFVLALFLRLGVVHHEKLSSSFIQFIYNV